MANVPDDRSPDFLKMLFWSAVLILVFIAMVIALLSYYYRPTFERVQ